MTRQLVKAAVSIAAVAASLAVVAEPTVFITDGTVSSGPITGTNGIVTYVNSSFGTNWGLVVTSGTTKPTWGTAANPILEVDIVAQCTAPGSDLTIYFSDTDFGPCSGDFVGLLSGHAFSGQGAPVTFSTYFDSNNVLLATTTLLTTMGPLSGPTYYH